MADLDPLPDEGLFEHPGVLFRSPEADCPFDPDLLDAKIEAKIGENKIKTTEFSDDGMQAYVELIDKAGNTSYRSICRVRRIAAG